jgi:large conductance mechanosensitive channel
VTVLQDFKKFLFRGNVVDLAVAVVIGAAFTAVVKALVTDIVTPIIAAIVGQPNFENLTFTINDSVDRRGGVFLVVAPINALMARRAEEDPSTKECPECTSAVPLGARRCPLCTSQIAEATA